MLDPGWTTYERRVLYSTYDVTEYLQQGANAVAVVLGQGWYDSRASAPDEHRRAGRREADGDRERRDLDRRAPGPIVSDSVYDGETYDARLETPGWDMPGFKDADLEAAPPPSIRRRAKCRPR